MSITALPSLEDMHCSIDVAYFRILARLVLVLVLARRHETGSEPKYKMLPTCSMFFTVCNMGRRCRITSVTIDPELSMPFAILFKGTRVVIPEPRRRGMLIRVHHGLLARMRCKETARELMF